MLKVTWGNAPGLGPCACHNMPNGAPACNVMANVTRKVPRDTSPHGALTFRRDSALRSCPSKWVVSSAFGSGTGARRSTQPGLGDPRFETWPPRTEVLSPASFQEFRGVCKSLIELLSGALCGPPARRCGKLKPSVSCVCVWTVPCVGPAPVQRATPCKPKKWEPEISQTQTHAQTRRHKRRRRRRFGPS